MIGPQPIATDIIIIIGIVKKDGFLCAPQTSLLTDLP